MPCSANAARGYTGARWGFFFKAPRPGRCLSQRRSARRVRRRVRSPPDRGSYSPCKPHGDGERQRCRALPADKTTWVMRRGRPARSVRAGTLTIAPLETNDATQRRRCADKRTMSVGTRGTTKTVPGTGRVALSASPPLMRGRMRGHRPDAPPRS